MQDGFLRAAAASIPVAVADPRRNAAAVCARIDQAHRARAALLVLPELCVTGYTCGDLFLSALLLDAAEEALLNICAHTQNCDPVVVLGVPLRAGGKLYNCAAVLHRGRILGVVPKTWLPNYDVFAEKRCFASAAAYHGPGSVPVSGADVPFGTGLVFACAQMPAFRLGVELCEDVWAPIPPSVRLCLAGATVIANCSASPEAAALYRHNEQSLRVVERIENGGAGLNLTAEVRDGILNHTGDLQAETCEGRIVGTADRIAYVNHDIDDAMRAGILTEADIPPEIAEILGHSHSQRINTLVENMIDNTIATGTLGMQPEIAQAMDRLRTFMFARVYTNPVAKGEETKAKDMLCRLFEYYMRRPEKLPADFLPQLDFDGMERIVCDYIAGMTDRYAVYKYSELFIPTTWQMR